MPTNGCQFCGAVFNSIRARRMHWSGPPNAMRCLEPAAMIRKGMTQNSGQKWRAPLPPSGTYGVTSGSTSKRFAKTATRFD